MKTRILIASLVVFVLALTLAIFSRTPAIAQEESERPADDEQYNEPADPEASEEEDGEPEIQEFPPAELDNDSADDTSVAPESDGPADSEEPGDSLAQEDGEESDVIVEEDGEPLLDENGEPLLDGEAAEFEIESGEDGDLSFDFEEIQDEDAVAKVDEDSDRISVDFPDEEIRTILRIVADLFDLNLVVPESLTGRASIKLRNVTWQQVFDVVLSPVGFTYVEDGNIIKVVTTESLNLEPPVTRVIILDYAQAAGIKGTIEPLVDDESGGRVQIDERSNALVITERPRQMERIENIIADLDKPNVQVMIESKFIETRNRDLDNIGVNWASLEGYQMSAGPFSHGYEKEDISSSGSGRDFTDTTTTIQNGGTSITGQTVDETTNTRANSSTTTELTQAVFSADEFGVILSALRTSNDVKLVSNPTVVTLNNRPARIHIGEEFPIVLPRFNAQTGTYEAGEYDTIDIGIKLDVTPQVNNAGFINMEVEPDVSTLASTVTYFGAQYPVRATRNAKSHVTIRDGYTLAIGGLLQDDTINGETRVPVLGSIPGLGRLFRSDHKDTDQRNLIIFITARTLDPEGSTIEETVDPRRIHAMGLKREDIPGYKPNIPMFLDEEIDEEEGADELDLDEEEGADELEIDEEEESPVEGDEDGEVDEDAEAGEAVSSDSEAVSENEVEMTSGENEATEVETEEASSDESEPQPEATEESEKSDSAEEAESTEEDDSTSRASKNRRNGYLTSPEESKPEESDARPSRSSRGGWLTP